VFTTEQNAIEEARKRAEWIIDNSPDNSEVDAPR
jgi:hypothetical protein